MKRSGPTIAEVETAALYAGVALSHDEADLIAQYLAADAETRADIEAFHVSGGAEKLRRAHEKFKEPPSPGVEEAP